MITRGLVAAALLGLTAVITLVVLRARPTTDDRIARICVAPESTANRDQRLDADAEIVVHIYLDVVGEGECISSTSFSRVPTVESVGATRWRVAGGFVGASPEQPRTPDCGGGLVVAALGRLGAGSYAVESSLGELRFDLPSAESWICKRAGSNAGGVEGES
jgi:hypothetical protein